MESGPDGGLWGWLAVLGCFMGNVIGDGLMYRWGEVISTKDFVFLYIYF